MYQFMYSKYFFESCYELIINDLFSKGTHQAQMFCCQYVGTSTPLKSPAKASMFIWGFPPMTRTSMTTQGLVFNSKLLVNSSLNLSSLYLKNFTSDMLFSCNYMKIMGNQLRRFFFVCRKYILSTRMERVITLTMFQNHEKPSWWSNLVQSPGVLWLQFV